MSCSNFCVRSLRGTICRSEAVGSNVASGRVDRDISVEILVTGPDLEGEEHQCLINKLQLEEGRLSVLEDDTYANH